MSVSIPDVKVQVIELVKVVSVSIPDVKVQVIELVSECLHT